LLVLIVPDNSKEHSAFIYRVKRGLLDPEDKGVNELQNIRNYQYYLNKTAAHSRRL
jgi:hypothetical protein